MTKKKKKPRTTWNLSNGYTITVIGTDLQICNQFDEEVLVIPNAQTDEWLESLSDASNSIAEIES